MNSVFWILVRKDLYLLRGLMVAIVLAGLLALGLTLLGKFGFAVGGILYLIASVAGGMFIAIFTIFNERKDLTRAFSMSLPISGAKYEQAKVVAGYLAYLLPWLLLSLMALALFMLPGAHHGMLVYVLVLQGFVLALFSVMLTVLFFVKSEVMMGPVILSINLTFSLFMVALNYPAISGGLDGPNVRWTPFALWMFAGEVLAIVLSIVIALFRIGRRRDYI